MCVLKDAVSVGGCLLLAFGSCAGPAFFTLTVAQVPPSRQGEMQAGTSFVMLFAACASAVLHAALFHALPIQLSYFCFLPGAILLLVGLIGALLRFYLYV